MYYHLSTLKSMDFIDKNGIVADSEGYIYLLDTKLVDITDSLAANQLFTSDYCLYGVSPSGVTEILETDDVGELTALHQFRIKQSKIELIQIKKLGIRKVDEKRLLENYMKQVTLLINKKSS